MSVSKPLKALFITRKWAPAIGGMESYSKHFADAASAQLPLDIIKLEGQENGAPPSGLSLVIFGLKTCCKLMKLPRQYTHIHGGDLALWPLIWIASRRHKRARMSIAVHGTDIALAYRRGFLARLYEAYVKLGSKALRPAHIIANSRATQNLLARAHFQNLSVVTLAAPLRPYQPTRPAESAYILYVGRLKKSKGCAWFIGNVLNLLPADIQLYVAAPEGNAQEMQALQHPRVTYLGAKRSDELVMLRRQALAVIIPNIDLGPNSFEGFGLTALEGTCDGALVLAADLFGLKDALEPGETGFLLQAQNAELWASTIIDIQSWPEQKRERFLRKAHEHLSQAQDWDTIVKLSLGLGAEGPSFKNGSA